MKISTCLWFVGNAREAAEYYVERFGGSITDNWLTPAQTPGNEVGSEVFVRFEILGSSFIALNGTPEFSFSEAISFELPCEDQPEIDRYWNMFIQDGGTESVCGWLKDKFGLSWQISSPQVGKFVNGPDCDGAKRATQALLEMRKIDLLELENAYLGV